MAWSVWAGVTSSMPEKPEKVTTDVQQFITDPSYTAWRNPKMIFCPTQDCHFADEDPDVIQTHILNIHKEEVLKAQGKLDGTKLTEDEKRAAIISSLPNIEGVCPFCLTKWNTKACREFNTDGKLSAMLFCKKSGGGCGRRMQASTMQWYHSPTQMGREVGAYMKFWKIVNEEGVGHDKWMKLLKALYPVDALMSQFWNGYGETNPKFAEKQRIKKAEREYAQQQDDDTPDEGGR